MNDVRDTKAEARADRSELRARTMVELKAKLRAAMGWPDRRSWTRPEREELAVRYTIRPDHARGDFVARPKDAETTS